MPPTAPQDHRKPAKKTTARKRATPQVEVVAVDPNDKYAPTTWGSELGGAEDLTVPSGQTCLVRRPGVQGLMEAGILHDLDTLTAEVLAVAEQTMQPTRASLWLRPPGSGVA